MPRIRLSDKKAFAMAHPSIAHTYGNVASLVTEYIKGLFPPNFFKTVHIQTTVAYKQLAIQRARNKEFFKKSKPMLIVRPRIELDDNDNFLYGTLLTQRMTDLYYNRDFTNLQPFIYDELSGIEVKWLLNRLKMFFDINIITETQMEQINVAHYLSNAVRQNHPFFLEVALESFIPNTVIKALSDELQIPIHDKKAGVKPLLDKLNSISYYPITYKLKKSTGNHEFFRYYPANVDTMFTGLGNNDGDKKGFVFDSFETSFAVSTEFNATGLYYYFTFHAKYLEGIQMDITTMNPKDQLIPIFTVTNLFDRRLPEGWTFYTTRMYNIDEDATTEDLLPIDEALNESIRTTIDFHAKRGIPMNQFIVFRVMMDNQELSQKDGEFVIDYERRLLITKRLSPRSTYRLIVYVNNRYINELVKREYSLE